MRERKMLLMLMMLALSIITAMNINPVYAIPNIYVSPPSVIDVKPGSFVTVSLKITGAVDVYAWEVQISWDPWLLELITVTEGTFLKKGGKPTYFPPPYINNPLGNAQVGATITGAYPGEGGSGTLASLKFKVEEVSNCSLHLHTPIVKDSALQPITVTLTDGYFDNRGLVWTWMEGNLVAKSAWPEHHHRNNLTDEDEFNTLYGKVRNIKKDVTCANVYVKVAFVVTGDGLDAVTYWSSVSPSLAPGGIKYNVEFDMGPFDALMVNQKYYVVARAWFSYGGPTGGVYWYGPGAKIKSFSFYVKG